MKLRLPPLKKLTAVACAMALTLSLLPAVQAAGSYRHSGATSLDKLSKQEIAQLLSENPNTMPQRVYDAEPSAPYALGKVSGQALELALGRLNALRRIAGVPAVELDTGLCESAQYGAVLTAANGVLSHAPSRPAGMDDDFYKQGYSAASSSNLYAGVTLTFAPDGFMDDSDRSNVDRVGHRRWQLNPDMGKVGFGYAQSQSLYGSYVAEKVFDRSGAGCDYDFIAWPASGSFPTNTGGFGANTAWSVSLNPGKFSVPSLEELTVTLTRESDGKRWTLPGSGSYSAASSGRYLTVDTGGYGISNCIIFRPEGVEKYQGLYTVTIDGLKSKSGTPVDFAYQVDFFNTETYTQEPEETTFSDVASDSWYAPYVTLASGEGLMTGTGDGKFSPQGSLTLAQTVVLAYQLHSGGSGVLPKVAAGSPWYAPYYQYCVDNGISLAGVDLSQMSRKATRYEMVALLDKAVPNSQMTPINDVPDGTIPDVSESGPYGAVVYKWYRAGALSGGSNYRFNGSSNITRAETCVILCQLTGLVDRVKFDIPAKELTALSISAGETSLRQGGSTTCSVTYTPGDAADKSLTWSSSDPAVATVSQSGVITAKGAGSAVITARAKNGVKASVTVQVSAQDKELTGLSLTVAQPALRPGDTTTCAVTYYPGDAADKSLTWSSSDPAVAAVSQSGVITAKAAGSAVITAQAKNGVKASATVQVSAAVQELGGLSITIDQPSLQVGKSTGCTVTYYPSDAADKSLTWSSSDSSVATVDQSGVITAKKEGSAVITAQAKNGVKASAVLKVTGSPSVNPQEMADEVVRLVNEEREKEGLAALSVNDNAAQAAQVRAEEILQLFEHTRPDGSSCFTALDQAGVSYWTAGENIARGYATPEDVVEGWMNSPGHRANILNGDFTSIGVGYAPGNAWVQLFVGSR